MYSLIKKQMASQSEILDFSKLTPKEQQKLYLNALGETRYKAKDWFRVILGLIKDYKPQETQSAKK